MARCAAAVAVLAACFPVPGRADAPPAASAVVERLNDTLLGVMKDAAGLGYQGRYDRLAPVLEETFDFDFMSRFVLGPGWQELSAEDQRQWTAAFRRVTIATYAGRFTGWGGEAFKMLGEEPAPQDTVFIKTLLDRPAGEEDVELTYRLRRTAAGWRVVDIYQKGTVSELALRRSEYSAVLKREGFATLLKTVDAKAADYAAGTLTQ